MQGFYEAAVADIADPTNQGRVRLQIPQVSGTAVTGWAYPLHAGWVDIGDTVYVTFKGGDRNYPVFVPASSTSPWLPLVIDPAFGPADPSLLPSVRMGSDGYLEFTGRVKSLSMPPVGVETVFATLPASAPNPMFSEHISATEAPSALSSRSTVKISAVAGTTTSTSYSATLASAPDPGPTVGFTAPGSGEVVVTLGFMGWNSEDGHGTWMSSRVTVGGAGGATFLAETDDLAAQIQGINRGSVMTCFPVTGLTPGAAYSVTAMYRSSVSTNTGNADNRFVRVDPVYPLTTPLVRVIVHTNRTLSAFFPWGASSLNIDLAGVRARYA